MSQPERRSPNPGVRRTVVRSVATLVGMFAFAFALVPLYDVFCRVTGINGKVDTTAQALLHEGVDDSRFVTVQFITRNGAGLDRKSTRLNSSHVRISYAVFCLKKKSMTT